MATQKQSISVALEATLLAGRMLMESGAEIYRIETTLGHLARSLDIEGFSAFVTTRGIFVSGNNEQGFAEASVITAGETVVNLRKLEEINILSRRVAKEHNQTPEQVLIDLKRIDQKVDYPLWATLLAYTVGAGAFTLALGSGWIDAIAAALTGLLIGLTYAYVERLIASHFLLTIVGSGVAVLGVNLLYQVGLGQHRSLILLGAFMVLVPGAIFVNAIRELSQNNFIIGSSLLTHALLVCLSISVGVAVTIEVLPFVGQMSETFSTSAPSLLGIFFRAIAAGFGTVSFAVLYSVRRRFYFDLGILGATTWFLYQAISNYYQNEIWAVFIPSLLVAFAAKALAIIRKSPATIFLATSFFPLIPGLGFYQAVYFILTGSLSTAEGYLRSSFITAFTIASAIAISQQFSLRKLIIFWQNRKKQS